jgi:hypothetical protein
MKIAPSSPSSPSHHQWLRCWNRKKDKQEAKSGKGKEKKKDATTTNVRLKIIGSAVACSRAGR